MVWVCPDDGIAAEFGEGTWSPLSDLVAEGFKSGRPGPALASAVRKAGQILADKFPRRPGDVNEIPDTVRVLREKAGQD
jgi:putative membrane protein